MSNDDRPAAGGSAAFVDSQPSRSKDLRMSCRRGQGSATGRGGSDTRVGEIGRGWQDEAEVVGRRPSHTKPQYGTRRPLAAGNAQSECAADGPRAMTKPRKAYFLLACEASGLASNIVWTGRPGWWRSVRSTSLPACGCGALRPSTVHCIQPNPPPRRTLCLFLGTIAAAHLICRHHPTTHWPR